MLIFKTVLLILFYFGFPVVIIYATQKSEILQKIGAVVLAYIVGLVVGNIGIFPRASGAFKGFLKGKANIPGSRAGELFEQGLITSSDLVANQVASVQSTLMSAVILLAIPLLLFSLDLKNWMKIAREAMISFGLAMVALLVAITVGYFIFRGHINEAWKITGMLVGLYTGGTPNLAVISTALEVDANTFLLTHSYDMVIGAVCLVFLITIAQRVFNLFLPTFKEKHQKYRAEFDLDHNEDIDSFIGILNRFGIVQLLKAFGFSSIVVSIGGAISMLVPEHSQMVTVVLSITTIALVFSKWKVVNRLENSFQLGMYFIIVFSLIVASMGNLHDMFHVKYLHLFSFVLVVMLGSILIHVLLSFLFKIDSDTTIITIAALTYSPPFVPVVAGALKNKNIIISGLTVGILGYAIGNYLGLALAYYLH